MNTPLKGEIDSHVIAPFLFTTTMATAFAADTSYSLVLLAEYTHTLDTLPIELSRNFADLRELDAVLSTSFQSMTAKIQSLTAMIEQGKASKADRLWLLSDIAEEAQRLKLGGEDKIRVACQAADNLKGHANHLRDLSSHLPGFDPSALDRKTVYPHVSDRSYMPVATMETGRRRRAVLGSIMTNPDPSPAKRRRTANKDDDIDVGPSRTPKKLAAGEGNARSRNNARAKKSVRISPFFVCSVNYFFSTTHRNERAISPSDSLVSVTSHLPPGVGHSTSARGGSNSANARSGNTASSNKRARTATNRNPTPLTNGTYPAHDLHNGTHTNGSRRGVVDAYNVPPPASHPSLPLPYQNGNAHLGNGYDIHGISHGIAGADWNIPRAQQLEGPGMPVARSASIHSTPVIPNNAVDATDAGDGDGDGDDRTYCFCDGVSYGEMIACDDEHCEREWVCICFSIMLS
jgi:inhibitor of growth protein 3